MAEPPYYTTTPPARRRMSVGLMAALGLLVLSLLALAVWSLGNAGRLGSFGLFAVKREAAAPAAPVVTTSPTATPTTAAQNSARVDEMEFQQGGLDDRLATMEQRLARLDVQSQAAIGNAARAEGLLVTFASRRAIERGAELGYLADQLRLRFGDAQPNAVQTVIEFARDPVTLDQLLARLDGLAPALAETPRREGLIGRVTRELGNLFVVRREDAPSPQPQRRLERARLFLESGRTDAAVAEVRNLPNAAAAQDWIADARRFAAAQRALELLETAALLEPRELRDGEGRTVRQLSPAAEL
jgi:hypothetical protein